MSAHAGIFDVTGMHLGSIKIKSAYLGDKKVFDYSYTPPSPGHAVEIDWATTYNKPLNPAYIWTDGTNYYYNCLYSNNNGEQSGNCVYDNTDNAFHEIKRDKEITYGSAVWNDGTNLYFDTSSVHYVFNRVTKNWDDNIWNGNNIPTNGVGIWSDGTNIYYSTYNSTTQESTNYIYDKPNHSWEINNICPLPSRCKGNDVWSDGINIYCDNGSNGHYILNTSTYIWESHTWSGNISSNISGMDIWTDGINIYYDNGGYNGNYIFDKNTSTWSRHTWNWVGDYTSPGLYGSKVKSFNGNIYCLNERKLLCILNTQNDTWTQIEGFKYIIPWSISDVINDAYHYGDNIFTDGTNYYYWDAYRHNDQYGVSRPKALRYDKNDGLWHADMTGSSYGVNYWWTDGTDIYESYFSRHSVYDRVNNIWLDKTWSGENEFTGEMIWTDGTDMYFTQGGNTFILNKSNSSWTAHSWNSDIYLQEPMYVSHYKGDTMGIAEGYINGKYVSAPAKLDKVNNSWVQWDTKNSPRYGYYTDNQHLYASKYNSSLSTYETFVLVDELGEWIHKTWVGIDSELMKSFYSYDIVTIDGEMYFVYKNKIYHLIP